MNQYKPSILLCYCNIVFILQSVFASIFVIQPRIDELKSNEIFINRYSFVSNVHQVKITENLYMSERQNNHNDRKFLLH